MIFQVFPHPHMIFIHPLGGSGAAISPFIVVNICVALSKTICIFVGRPICLTWMAMNGVPWPLRCISIPYEGWSYNHEKRRIMVAKITIPNDGWMQTVDILDPCLLIDRF